MYRFRPPVKPSQGTPIVASPGAGNVKAMPLRPPPLERMSDNWLRRNDPEFARRARAERKRKARIARSSRTYPLR